MESLPCLTFVIMIGMGKKYILEKERKEINKINTSVGHQWDQIKEVT